MSSSHCCFLTCIQISQEAGQVVLYSHLFQNFPQFPVIHTVKGFGTVNKAEIDAFLELSQGSIPDFLTLSLTLFDVFLLSRSFPSDHKAPLIFICAWLVMEIRLSYFKSWKMMLWKCCTQHASKFGKLSSCHRTGKGQFLFQAQRKAMPKNTQTTTQLHSSHTLVK